MGSDRERRQAELEGLQAMANASGGHMQVSAGPDLNEFTIHLHNVPAPVGTSESSFVIADQHELRIGLPDKFPEVMPVVSFKQPIFHPNCFTNGIYCHGRQWYPARRLDDLVAELNRNIQLQGDSAFNLASPANRDAARFYADSSKLASLRRRLRPVVISPVRRQAQATTTTGVRVVAKSTTPPQRTASIRRV